MDIDELLQTDGAVDRYVNPGDPALAVDEPHAATSPRVITARIWLVVRGVSPETGIQDNVNYTPGDVNLGQYNDQFRRMMVSKTILLRNARS